MNGPEPDQTLRELREEIARIDHAIVLLVAARLRAARRAIDWRAAHGEDQTNRDQELVVRDRAREWARQVAVPPEFAVHVIQALVNAGKEPARLTEDPLPPLPKRITCRLERSTAVPPSPGPIPHPADRTGLFRSRPQEGPVRIA